VADEVESESESGAVDASTLELATTSTDAPQLTKATWRQGKDRRLVKRVNNWGGRTEAPPAFLAAGKRFAFKPGRPGHRVCSATQRNGKPCTRLALHGMNCCESHGGALRLARQGRLQKSGRAAAAIAAKAEMMRSKMPEGRPDGVPPLELTRMPIYRRASQRQRIRLALAFGTDSWHGVVMSMRERDDPGDDRNR
jgi:hypothetical protein